jgi:hypothetical protein
MLARPRISWMIWRGGLYLTADLSFDEAALPAGNISVDISQYLVPGISTIQYNPVGRGGKATVTVVIE